MKKTLLVILTLAAFFLSSCMLIPDTPAIVKGSGVVISETRPVTSFNSVSLDSSVNVHIGFGPAESVVITGEDNIVFLIETNVQDGQLVIRTKPQMSYKATKPVLVDVTMISLNNLSLSSSGNMEVLDFNGDTLQVDLSGSGNLDISGVANSVNFSLSSSGNLNASQLKANTAIVDSKGSGNIQVCASESLNATLSSSGNVQFSGNPANVNEKVTGSGKIFE